MDSTSVMAISLILPLKIEPSTTNNGLFKLASEGPVIIEFIPRIVIEAVLSPPASVVGE